MMKLLRLLVLAVALHGCVSQSDRFVPFGDVNLESIPADEVVTFRQAQEDFHLVVSGKRPIYAKFDDDFGIVLDGGTHRYRGNRYYLTVFKSISIFGSQSGYVFGPLVEFDRDLAPGNESRVSYL